MTVWVSTGDVQMLLGVVGVVQHPDRKGSFVSINQTKEGLRHTRRCALLRANTALRRQSFEATHLRHTCTVLMVRYRYLRCRTHCARLTPTLWEQPTQAGPFRSHLQPCGAPVARLDRQRACTPYVVE